jgi:hypothetical protein
MTRATVSLAFKKLDVHALPSFADGTVVRLEGNAKFGSPTIPLTTIAAQSATLRATTAERSAGDRSVALTRQEAAEEDALIGSLTTNAHYIEDTSNALAAGDVELAKQLILTTGYQLRGHGTPGARGFEFLDADAGQVHVRGAKEHDGPESFLFRYGITSAKDVPPTVLVTRYVMRADLIIADLPSPSIVGCQYAVIVPVPRAAAPNTGGSHLALSGAGHIVISHNVADPYAWSDFIYTAVK